MKRKCLVGLLSAAAVLWAAGGVSAAPKGELVIGLAAEPPTFDPHLMTGFPLHAQLPLVFDNLLFFDRSGQVVPKVAQSYRLVGPTVWEFKLREGVKFSNGEPLDAHAVKYSLERILDPKLKSQQYVRFKTIARVEVVDRSTVRIHTKFPDMFLISPLALLGHIVPPKYYGSQSPAYLARHPVGSGPYRLVRWKKGEELVYEANPDYWMPGVPRIKRGVIKVIPEPTTRVAALVAGDVDIIDGVPPQLVSMVKANPELEVVAGGSPSGCRILLTSRPGAPWADARVRRALNYAVDKEGIIRHILRGHGKITAVNLGPPTYGFNPDLVPYPYDPLRARKLLAEAGYPKGFSAELLVPLGQYLMGKEAAEAIAGQLAKVGVEARVRTMEYGRMVTLWEARWKPDGKPFWTYGCRMDMYLHTEGIQAQEAHSRGRWSGFRDRRLDKLIDEARSEPDDARRLQKYRDLNRIIHEEAGMIFLYQLDQISAKRKRVDWAPRANAVLLLSEMGLKD